jgi:hypothetical protein
MRDTLETHDPFWPPEKLERIESLMEEFCDLMAIAPHARLLIAEALGAAATALKLAIEKGTTEGVILYVVECEYRGWHRVSGEQSWPNVPPLTRPGDSGHGLRSDN